MTGDQIVDVALELIQEKGGPQEVNLREIARRLGCAHTNLYNYFPRYSDLLWAVLDEAARRMLCAVSQSTQPGLRAFFSRYMDYYLEHAGWFRLLWLEPLQTPRSAESRARGEAMIIDLVDAFRRASAEDGAAIASHAQAEDRLHAIHCYLFGEITIYFSGRGRIREEGAFRDYVLQNCLKLATSLEV